MKPAVSFLVPLLPMGCTLLLAAFSSEAAPNLPMDETPVFMGSGGCVFCHAGGGRVLTDSKGRDLSIVNDWRATMMANSFRDPYWQAKIEREVEENPSLRTIIEDKCTRCHAPMGRTQAHLDGAETYSLAAARSQPLAQDGVSCTLCHQIQDRELGTHASYTGGYTIGQDRHIFGPYEDVFTMPMLHHVNYTAVHGAHVHRSELCATCHTLYTPILNTQGEITGEFPEQTPFLEWRNSIHPGQNRHCQDCHMPRVEEPIIISARPPWLEGRQPFWKHELVGGNTLLPALLQAHARELGVTATKRQFAKTQRLARRQLQQHAADLTLQTHRDADTLKLEVTVANRTGHKFPTGFPSRRAWLHLAVSDPAGRVLFESGDYDDEGRLLKLPRPAAYHPHHSTITSQHQTQVYEAVMADAQGTPTTTLLRAASYLKDNRIPPRGFRLNGPDYADIAIHGVPPDDSDFNRSESGEGSGSDTTLYLVETTPYKGPLQVTVELLYQPIQPAFADHLLEGQSTAVRRFQTYYEQADRRPVVVRRLTRTVAPSS